MAKRRKPKPRDLTVKITADTSRFAQGMKTAAKAMRCKHPGAIVSRPSHFGKVRMRLNIVKGLDVETTDGAAPWSMGLTDALRCSRCGDSVRIRIEPVVFPEWQGDLVAAVEGLTGRKQLAVCEFVSAA